MKVERLLTRSRWLHTVNYLIVLMISLALPLIYRVSMKLWDYPSSTTALASLELILMLSRILLCHLVVHRLKPQMRTNIVSMTQNNLIGSLASPPKLMPTTTSVPQLSSGMTRAALTTTQMPRRLKKLQQQKIRLMIQTIKTLMKMTKQNCRMKILNKMRMETQRRRVMKNCLPVSKSRLKTFGTHQ